MVRHLCPFDNHKMEIQMSGKQFVCHVRLIVSSEQVLLGGWELLTEHPPTFLPPGAAFTTFACPDRERGIKLVNGKLVNAPTLPVVTWQKEERGRSHSLSVLRARRPQSSRVPELTHWAALLVPGHLYFLVTAHWNGATKTVFRE